MRVCFVTDLHIDEEGQHPLGIDTRQKFLTFLADLQNQPFDIIVIGGDLCHNVGDAEIYRWIKSHMDGISIPYYVIGGNHDDTVMMATVFGCVHLLHDLELYYSIKVEDNELLLLDTSRGYMSDAQYKWLDAKISITIGDEVTICMHHPPILCGAAHMEPKYFFNGTEKFQELCSKYPTKNFTIFCGHYHLERTVFKDNITVVVTPSTFVQIDPDYIEFKIGDDRYGYREIIMSQSKLISTRTIYLQDQLTLAKDYQDK